MISAVSAITIRALPPPPPPPPPLNGGLNERAPRTDGRGYTDTCSRSRAALWSAAGSQRATAVIAGVGGGRGGACHRWPFKGTQLFGMRPPPPPAKSDFSSFASSAGKTKELRPTNSSQRVQTHLRGGRGAESPFGIGRWRSSRKARPRGRTSPKNANKENAQRVF